LVQIYGGDYETVDGTGIRDYIHVMDLVTIPSIFFCLVTGVLGWAPALPVNMGLVWNCFPRSNPQACFAPSSCVSKAGAYPGVTPFRCFFPRVGSSLTRKNENRLEMFPEGKHLSLLLPFQQLPVRPEPTLRVLVPGRPFQPSLICCE
jgi:hypothetical protein